MRVSLLVSLGVWGLSVATQGQAQTGDAPSPLPIFDTETGDIFLPESIIEPNTLVDIERVRDTDFYEMARIVARVERHGRGFCTGFRVGESLFMTNYHCWEFGACDVAFNMGFEKELPPKEAQKFKCVEVLSKLERLDYALYRVEPVDGVIVNDYPVAILSRQELSVDMPLLVPGHPSARPKQIDISEQCLLTRAIPYKFFKRESIQHQCDTTGGSSGSPVLDRDTGYVVGLHWGAAGRTGSNHAIPMNLILDHIAEQLPHVVSELSVVE